MAQCETVPPQVIACSHYVRMALLPRPILSSGFWDRLRIPCPFGFTLKDLTKMFVFIGIGPMLMQAETENYVLYRHVHGSAAVRGLYSGYRLPKHASVGSRHVSPPLRFGRPRSALCGSSSGLSRSVLSILSFHRLSACSFGRTKVRYLPIPNQLSPWLPPRPLPHGTGPAQPWPPRCPRALRLLRLVAWHPGGTSGARAACAAATAGQLLARMGLPAHHLPTLAVILLPPDRCSLLALVLLSLMLWSFLSALSCRRSLPSVR